MPYANLPGLTNILRDNQLGALDQGPVGESTFIVGTATDGPNEPMRISNAQEIELVFGEYLSSNGRLNGASLIPAVLEALQAGCTNVGVMRLGGTRASIILKDDTVDTPVEQLTIKGRYAGAKYNSVKVAIDAEKAKLTITGIKKNSTTGAWESDTNREVEYDLADYINYGELIDAINADQATHGAIAEVVDNVSLTAAIKLDTLEATELTDGSDGLNPTSEEINALLTNADGNGALDLLIDIDMDYIVVPDLFIEVDFETKKVDFANAMILGEFCHNASERNGMTFASIAVRPLDNPTTANIKNLVDILTDAEKNVVDLTGTVVDTEDNPVDLGRYLTFTVGEAAFNVPKLGAYHAPFNIAYFGLCSQLSPNSAPTNKSIRNVLGLRYKFSLGQLDRLTAARYVTLRERFGRGIVITDGITAAQPSSDYSRFSTARIVKAATNVVNEVLDPFLGEAGNEVTYNSMNTALEAGMKAMYEAGALQAYRYQIISTPQELVLGRIRVLLDVVPAFEIRRIIQVVTLRRSLD